MHECSQEKRITKTETLLEAHSLIIPTVVDRLQKMSDDLRAIKWCAVGGAVGYFVHQLGFFEIIKRLVL